jgi:hypothetical protein
VSEEKSDADLDLLAAIESAESLCYGADVVGDLSDDRARSIDDYMGRPYGNEVAGRSQVVSRDVYDTIEWIKPSLIRIFTSGDRVAEFDPVGPEDEAQAEQETDYINHVLTDKNNFFTLCYEWFSDALLTKNAYALAYWDTSRQVETETFSGLTDLQLSQIAQDGQLEIVAYEKRQSSPSVDQLGQPVHPQTLHDVKIKRTREYKGVKTCVLPPENCLISENLEGMSVRNADFFEFFEDLTISEIRKRGFDIDEDISDDIRSIDTTEGRARDQFSENISTRNQGSGINRRVRLRTLWIKYDYDGDGIAEMRMIMMVGREILFNDESTGVQVSCIVPTILAHRHPGLSVRDMIHDLQLIKTTIWRQTLDNLYLANNGRYGISDKVNLEDMLTSRPGGVVRVSGGASPVQEILPLVHPFVAGQSLEVLDYTDRIIEHRTGTNQSFTGVDPNALSKAHSGVAIAQLSSAAAQRVELIARVFAEGVKELFHIVHELCIRHDHNTNVVRLKGQWVNVNPSEWKRRTDLRISVGLGTGNREQMMQNLGVILQEQKALLPLGLATPEKIYNAQIELVKAAGFPNADKFWAKPPPGMPPQPPAPEAIKAQTEVQLAQLKEQFETQRLQMELESRERIETAKIQADMQIAAAKLGVETQRLQLDGAVENEKFRMEGENRESEKELKQIELAKSKVELQKTVGEALAPDAAQKVTSELDAVKAALANSMQQQSRKPLQIALNKVGGKTRGVRVTYDDGSEHEMAVN